ncbi:MULTISPECIES: heavy-metal-associated domain-containing protein [Shewanella]|jgi:mercuric ion binding protein|uniref:Copper-exporting P-type ATPase A n=5 Tax=Bacteria TaxID=2 RepID=A0A1S2B233_9GAMM|nr:MULTISPECIES: heavy metal-associated domain-containing protein [Shewanella]BCV38164.1 heavy metal transporter [Shewanella chilikensis]AXQ14715.1 heavy metal transporter [Shewanella algae]AYV12465.1 heavy-metal-associated domain-containing protein [Shewanella algae]EKT4486558.1 heavy-metal-associated domain-containing protein [Shewanella algae]MBC8797862.1 heavy-metal-associated domain-containing protein [Shewanella algae]
MRSLLLVLLLLCTPFAWAGNLVVTLDVKGMTCPLCVTVINKALRKTEGVIKAKSSLKTQQARVIVPEGFDMDALIKAVDETGYKGSINKIEPEA